MGQSSYTQHIYVDPGRQPGAAGPRFLSFEEAWKVQLGLFSLALKVIVPKRVDYSGKLDPYRNLRSSEVLDVEPWRGALVRMLDKVSRVVRLAESGGEGKVKEETLLDSFADMLNYACIAAGLVIESLPDEKRKYILDFLSAEAERLAQQIRADGNR